MILAEGLDQCPHPLSLVSPAAHQPNMSCLPWGWVEKGGENPNTVTGLLEVAGDEAQPG